MSRDEFDIDKLTSDYPPGWYGITSQGKNPREEVWWSGHEIQLGPGFGTYAPVKGTKFRGPLVVTSAPAGGERNPHVLDFFTGPAKAAMQEMIAAPASSEPPAEGERVTDRDGSGLSASDNSHR